MQYTFTHIITFEDGRDMRRCFIAAIGIGVQSVERLTRAKSILGSATSIIPIL
jgi:hypothetical protein